VTELVTGRVRPIEGPEVGAFPEESHTHRATEYVPGGNGAAGSGAIRQLPDPKGERAGASESIEARMKPDPESLIRTESRSTSPAGAEPAGAARDRRSPEGVSEWE
jgi:hypothetical protein